MLGQLEREPGEYVVDRWVTGRATLVATNRDRLVGAAHLLRYGVDDRVSPSCKDAGEIRWLVFWPGQHPTAAGEMAAAADSLTAASLAQLGRWNVGRCYADAGALPAPGVYGVPDRWPHVAAALERCGFTPSDRIEVVLVADVGDLPRAAPAPLPGLSLRVALGGGGTRFSAVLDGGEIVGIHEVESDLTAGGTLSRLTGWADVGERWVRPDHRRHGIGTWLAGHAADRLRLARVDRLLDYVTVGDGDESVLPFLAGQGFTELTRTCRGWTLGS